MATTYGARLLIHALSEIAKASESIGFELVVVHAIDAEAVTFYAKAGFMQFEAHELHLFMPVMHLLTTLDQVG